MRSFEARTSSPVADGVGLMLPDSRSSLASRGGRSIVELMRLTMPRDRLAVVGDVEVDVLVDRLAAQVARVRARMLPERERWIAWVIEPSMSTPTRAWAGVSVKLLPW